MTLPWWTGVPAAQATLACIELLDIWRRHTEDPDVLVLGSRGPADLIAVPEEMPRQLAQRMRSGPGRPTVVSGGASTVVSGGTAMVIHSAQPPAATDPDPAERLARLLSLGGGLGRRLDATVAAHWRDRLLSPDAETERLKPRLYAALYGRALATLAGCLGQSDSALELELAPEGASPSLRRAADGGLVASLPFGWLVDVWARGLEVVWGRFCLAATTADGREWELRTIGSDLREPATLTVTMPG